MTSFLFICAVVSIAFGTKLECFTGYSIMHGSTIGSETKECGKETDSCYNATVHVGDYAKLQKAGCNTVLCQFYQNQCFDQLVAGRSVTFCCCSDSDRCNGGKMVDSGSLMDKGFAMARGLASLLGR